MRRGVRGSAETDTERCHGGEPQDTAIETLAKSKSKKIIIMPTDEDDQDGHFFYNHPERGAYPAA